VKAYERYFYDARPVPGEGFAQTSARVRHAIYGSEFGPPARRATFGQLILASAYVLGWERYKRDIGHLCTAKKVRACLRTPWGPPEAVEALCGPVSQEAAPGVLSAVRKTPACAYASAQDTAQVREEMPGYERELLGTFKLEPMSGRPPDVTPEEWAHEYCDLPKDPETAEAVPELNEWLRERQN